MSRLSKNTPPVTSPRGAERRAAILRAARDLVSQKGFRDAQMAAVAERAGVALGTLYRYFPSKVELMVEVVALVAQRELDVVASVAAGKEHPVERLSASVWTFASRALQGHKMAHALIAEAVEPEIESARLKERRKLARVFETIIGQGIRDQVFPPQDVQAAGACIVGSLFEGLVGPLAFESFATSEERVEQALAIVGFCMRGVSGSNAFVLPKNNVAVSIRRGRAKR